MRILFFILFVYILIKLFRGMTVFKNVKKASDQFKKAYSNPYGNPTARQESPLIDEMKKCPTCGTFNPMSIALRRGSEYFCDTQCLK